MIKKGTKLLNIDKLVCAIVKCAVNDYKAELRHVVRFQGKGQHIGETVETFFKSEYFEFIITWTDLKGFKGDEVIQAIKEKENKRKRKRKNGE